MENTISHPVNYVPLPEAGNPGEYFEISYIRLRQQEKWIYSDEELSSLPAVTRDDPHYGEWKLRQESCRRLVNHLRSKPGFIQVLDVGCGNGWLANQMATVYGTYVTGIDVNKTELEQAARVFGRAANLQFLPGDISSPSLAERKYDLVIFAASIQYFSSLQTIIGTAMNLLKADGEIHILDSHLYKSRDVNEARKRSEQYFNQLGMPGFTRYYFHHSWNDLDDFNYQVLYKPSRMPIWTRINRNPFPWLVIRKK